MSSLKKNNLYVLGAMSISQYMIPEKTSLGEQKILTIIGEDHREEYEDFKKDCPNPKITVYEYIKRISNNSDSNLMLEISPEGFGTMNYKSKNLNSLLEYIIEKEISAPVSGIDIRPSIIDSYSLYNTNHNLLPYHLIKIMSYFYMTMPGAINRLKSMISYELLTKDQINYLHTFLDQLNQEYILIQTTFLKTVDNLIRKSDKVTVKEYLSHNQTVKGVDPKGKPFVYTMIDIFRRFWMKVTDFVIINNLYMSDRKHNILLIGYNHANNLDDIFFNYRIYPSKHKLSIESSIKNCTYVSKLTV